MSFLKAAKAVRYQINWHTLQRFMPSRGHTLMTPEGRCVSSASCPKAPFPEKSSPTVAAKNPVICSTNKGISAKKSFVSNHGSAHQ